MVADNDMTRGLTACSVEVSPGEVDAGADMTLKGKVSCAPAGDLRGESLLIKDHDGALAEAMELTEFDGETNETREFVVKAPVRPGAYTWLAVPPVPAIAGVAHEDTSALFYFTVKPHGMRVVVWDAPSAIQGGETFRVKLGVKCSSGCRPDGWVVEVRNHDGEKQATATLSDEPWPGTSALYTTEVDLSAPDAEGLYAWEATALADGPELPHAKCLARFAVRVVSSPGCLLTVVAIDAERQTPVHGVKVVVHPYKAFTDERGVAKVRVPEGEYRLFVSGKNYFPFRCDREVKTDVTIRAELALDLGLSDADRWS